MTERFNDDLAQRIQALTAADAADPNELKQALIELSLRYRGQQGLLDRLIRISDGFQRAEKLRADNRLEQYERDVKRIERVTRISDGYQSLLHGSQMHYREIFDHAPLAFLLLDCQGKIEDWNRAAENIFGWRREEVIGKRAFELLAPPSELTALEGMMSTTLQDRVPTHSINKNLTRWGKVIVCEWNNVLRYDSSGDLVGILALGVDISERLRLEDDLRQAKVAAEQALEDQRHFLAMASHEFRSPLAVVASAAQLLELRCRDDEDTLRVVQRIRRAVRRLSGFLENCLTEDRLDTQHWALAGERFVLPEFLRSIVDQMQQMTSHHCITYVERGAPAHFYGDPHLLRVMLHNLIENAVKYSPAGGQITVIASEGSDRSLLLMVKDEGIGIPVEDQGKVFSKYFRGQVGGGISGAGLGLYLVARIVALHRGKISLESVPGQGTCFTVALPAMDDAMLSEGSKGSKQ